MKFVARWVLLVVFGVTFASAQQGNSIAFQRAEHLRRGVNLSMWYAQTRDNSAAHIDSFTTPADFALIKSLGFDHVRLSINPEPLIASGPLGSLRIDAMQRLDKSVQQILDAGLNVVLDIHPEQNWKDDMTKGEDGPQKLYAFWTNFALHFAPSDPTRVFFELMTEPNLSDWFRWEGIQSRAIERIRKVAPQHTIIATPASWGALDALLEMEPVQDDNVIYTFHYYTPFWFTHQGAQWGTQNWVYLRGVPYPSTPENIQAVIGQEPDPLAKLQLQRYGWDRWDAPRIGMEFAAAADWAQKRGVPLYLGEFGVFKDYSVPAMRDTWISDVRTAAESKHIGWCMWDYQANFGMVTKGPSGTVVDDGVVHALGLRK
jgi:endoglucanase